MELVRRIQENILRAFPVFAEFSFFLLHAIPLDRPAVALVNFNQAVSMEIKPVGKSECSEDPGRGTFKARSEIYIGLEVFVEEVGNAAAKENIGITVATYPLIFNKYAPFRVAESMLKRHQVAPFRKIGANSVIGYVCY